MFESNVNYDLGKTAFDQIHFRPEFESNVNYDLGKTQSSWNPPSASLRAM